LEDPISRWIIPSEVDEIKAKALQEEVARLKAGEKIEGWTRVDYCKPEVAAAEGSEDTTPT